MAILDSLSGIEVTICVNGEPLVEYEDNKNEDDEEDLDEYKTERTICKFIESATDKNFSIKLTVKAPYMMNCRALRFCLKLDGVETRDEIIQQWKYKKVKRWKMEVNGQMTVRSNQPYFQAYKFTKLETTIEQSWLKNVKRDTEHVRDLGNIEIEVHRQADHKRTKRPWEDGADKLKVDSKTLVHYKAVIEDAKCHAASFGKREAIKGKIYYDTVDLDGKDKPLAIFRFKYRSKEALKTLGIIEGTPEPERIPTPPPLPEVKVTGLSAEQKARLDVFLKKTVGVSSTAVAGDSRIKAEIKEEDGVRPTSKKQKGGKKAPIDLTSDSDDDDSFID